MFLFKCMFQILISLVLVVLEFVLPLGMTRFSDSDLQQSSEEGSPSEKYKEYFNGYEEEAILATSRVLNGEDVPSPKKRGRPSKGGESTIPPKKKKYSTKKTTKKAAKEVVDLDGGSSLEGEGSVPTKWRDYEVKMLIAIWEEMEEEFSRCAKKKGNFFLIVCFFCFFPK
jgi:hypothetical protein